jgi:ketosteroid isomerase-like protein
MSQENVELVREGFARWNEGDYDFFFSFAAPDIELLSRFGSLTGEPYRGHEGVREWLADIQQTFERFDLWLDDVRDLGDEVLAIGGIHMRSRGSGLDMKEPMGWVFEVRDGRVARMRFYAPPAEALEAVAQGVGDVAGERGDCPSYLRELGAGILPGGVEPVAPGYRVGQPKLCP